MKIDFGKAAEASFISLDGVMLRIWFSINEEEKRELIAHDDDDDEFYYSSHDEFEAISYFRLEEF